MFLAVAIKRKGIRMDKKLVFIDITFENLDSIMIPADYVVSCLISDFNKKIICTGRVVERYTQADYVRLELRKAVDNDAVNFEGAFCTVLDGSTRLSERLNACDITHIDLVYEDGKKESFLVAWNEKNEYHNEYQKVWIDKHNNICVSIAR